MLDTIATVLTVTSAILSLACVVFYARETGGAWRDSEVGRHLMAFMAVVAAVLFVSAIRIVLVNLGHDEATWFRIIRLILFGFVPVVLVGRLRLIVKTQREHDREDNVSG